jgi:glutathione S-transferase
MSADLLIYGMKGSPFVRKVQVVLEEKGVPYDFQGVNIFPAPDWFAEISPARKIPVLRDRSVAAEGAGGTIPDSSAICAYVERKHPSPPLYPSDAFAHARALWLEEYADSELASRIGLGMFRPLVVARLLGKEPDVERGRKTMREDLPPLFDYLGSVLGDADYLIDGAFGIADIALASQLVNLRFAGGSIDAARWPGLASYAERILARPSFAKCIADESRFFPPGDDQL